MADFDCLFTDAAELLQETLADSITVTKSDGTRLRVSAVVGERHTGIERTDDGVRRVDTLDVMIRRSALSDIEYDWTVTVSGLDYRVDRIDEGDGIWTVGLRRRSALEAARGGYRTQL